MITITRRRARELRAVFRRTVLGLPPRGAMPPIVLRADDGELRSHYRHGCLAVEHVCVHPPGPTAMLVLPPEALADIEGRDDSPVALESTGAGRVTASWAEHGSPRSRDYTLAIEAPDDGALRRPSTWADVPGELLDALAEAARVAGKPGRYALDCIRVGGGSGQVAATDGRQLLIRAGFALPWGGELLIDASPVFGRLALPRGRPLRMGCTGTHVVLDAGPWTTWCEIRVGVRFPDIDGAVPAPSGSETVIRLDGIDAGTLATALGRLPGAGEVFQPVTLECNGSVSVRARDPGTSRIAELVLGRSGYSGPPIRLCTDRRFLARAARLGCGTIEIAGADAPLVGRDDHLTYAWQPLGPDGAIGHAEGETVFIEASDSDRPADRVPVPHHRPSTRPVDRLVSDPVTNPTTPRSPMHEPPRRNGHETEISGPQSPKLDPVQPAANLAALIVEAERLHASLGEAKVGLARLIAGLRRHRKQSKLVAETLRSLRQLKLADAAE